MFSALFPAYAALVSLSGRGWLWNRSPWGYVLGVVWSVKGAVY
ncbi:MAG: hypothetical protein ACOCUW_01625 [Gemmatimonadota bacterium]